jgi:hypothetical protein
MVYPETDLKFRITNEITDFDVERDDFEIQVMDYYGRSRFFVPKDSFYKDSVGRWYFNVEGLNTGIYYAKFKCHIPDEDYNKGYRVYTDEQQLCVVGICEHYLARIHDCQKDNHLVHYEQVWSVNLDDGTYLCGSDGELILTEDGQRIKFLN